MKFPLNTHPLNQSTFAAVCLLFVALAPAAHAQAVIAHRGASHDAPENTLSAFRLAWEQGADGIEADFYLTKDKQIVCLHDANTGRTGDKKLIVADSTLAELRTVDVGSWKHEKFAGEKIPTLDEVLAVVPAGKRIFVEIKCGPEIVPALASALEESTLGPNQVAVICFDQQVIHDVRKRLPKIPAYWLKGLPAKDAPQPQPDEILQKLRQIQASGLDADSDLKCLTAEFVQQLTDAGFEIHCWTINDEAKAHRAQALGAKSITTDRPAYLRQLLSPRGN